MQVVDDVHAEDGSAGAGQDEVKELSAVEDADQASDGQGHDRRQHHPALHGEVFLRGRRVDCEAEDDGACDADRVDHLVDLVEAGHDADEKALADCVSAQQDHVHWRLTTRGLRETYDERQNQS